MASTAKIAANKRRERTVARYAARRAELKGLARTAPTLEERMDALKQLQKLPRDASPVRLRNRDSVDGRPRGYLRKVVAKASAALDDLHRGDVGLGGTERRGDRAQRTGAVGQDGAQQVHATLIPDNPDSSKGTPGRFTGS